MFYHYYSEVELMARYPYLYPKPRDNNYHWKRKHKHAGGRTTVFSRHARV